MYDTLIDATTLKAQLPEPDWVVVDCRFNLLDTEAGRRAYQEGHIPGARYAHLDEDLSSPMTAESGRHPLPTPEALAATLGRWGIDRDTQVVAYDAAGGMVAARLWWMLRWLGHGPVAVLDGGLPAWIAADYPLDNHIPTPTPRTFVAAPDRNAWLDVAAVVAAADHGYQVVDARSGSRYRGEQEPIDTVAGHIPGSLNYPQDQNLSAGHFLAPNVLRERFQTLLGRLPPEQVVHSCGSGVSACHNLLAMEVAELHGSKLYPGSWSEWIRHPQRPIAQGEED